jgi:hypothetical protein
VRGVDVVVASRRRRRVVVGGIVVFRRETAVGENVRVFVDAGRA